MFVSINNKLINKDDANISIFSEGFSYGFGLFETIKIENGKIIFFDEHIERLKNSTKELGMEFSQDIESLKKHCYELINKNHIKKGVLKITLTKNTNSNILIISNSERYYENNVYDKGFKIKLSKVKRNQFSILPYIKSNNYMENYIERQIALENGYDEILFLNIDNKVCEGAISNIFYIKNNIIYTPKVECGLLPGIVRKKIIDLAKNLGCIIIEDEFSLDEVLSADEVFLTNSLFDIMPVNTIDNRRFDINVFTLTKKIRNEYYKIHYRCVGEKYESI